MCLRVMDWPSLVIRHPVLCVIWMKIFRMRLEESLRLGPQCWNALRSVVKVDRETICLVVILHVTEDVVVDITKKVDLGLDAPVILDVFERWVLVEEARVPPAHLVV